MMCIYIYIYTYDYICIYRIYIHILYTFPINCLVKQLIFWSTNRQYVGVSPYSLEENECQMKTTNVKMTYFRRLSLKLQFMHRASTWDSKSYGFTFITYIPRQLCQIILAVGYINSKCWLKIYWDSNKSHYYFLVVTMWLTWVSTNYNQQTLRCNQWMIMIIIQKAKKTTVTKAMRRSRRRRRIMNKYKK